MYIQIDAHPHDENPFHIEVWEDLNRGHYVERIQLRAENVDRQTLMVLRNQINECIEYVDRGPIKSVTVAVGEC